MQLRPRQVKAISDLQQAYRDGAKSPIIRASTGWGKTAASATIIKNAIAKGKRIWFSAHLRELLIDTSKRLTQAKINHAWICAGFPMALSHQVQIVSAETLRRRIDKIPSQYRPDILIVDEAHIGLDRTKEMQETLEVKHSLLLTATPILLNGDGLGKISDLIIETGQTRELIEEGLLCNVRYFAPTNLDTSDLHIKMGEYSRPEVEELVTKPSIIGDAVKSYTSEAKGRPAVAFCHSLKHAAETAEAFQTAGYRVMVVHGDSTDAERRQAIFGLANGLIDIVCNCQLWIAGVDCPEISCVILLTPTKSLPRFLQSIGRGLRLNSLFDDLIVLDHANCWMDHGLPTHDREWYLDYGEARKARKSPEEIRVKECPECFAKVESFKMKCSCGHEFIPEGRKIEIIEGDLHEIDPETVARKEMRRQQGQANSLEALEEFARRTGKKPGWAKHVWDYRQKKEQQKLVDRYGQLFERA